jgi:rhamnulokinase
MAREARPFAAIIDPDDASFIAPGDMPARLATFCQCTGQTAPSDEAGLVRCALEGLALKYRWVVDRLETIVGCPIRSIHIVGGGSRNTLLNQLTANACGRPVYAGPVEATAMGNLLMQAIGQGKLSGLADHRAVLPGGRFRAPGRRRLGRGE